jgi:hypothetical protein
MLYPALFGITIAFSFVVWGLVARRYFWPALRGRDRADALRPVLFLHAFRFMGLLFLIPGVVAPGLPASFAAPVAYGDLATAVLAVLALTMLSGKGSVLPIWLFNIVGTVDLLNAYYQGSRISLANAPGALGAGYVIPTLVVPLLLVTHALVFRILLRPQTAVLPQRLSHAA